MKRQTNATVIVSAVILSMVLFACNKDNNEPILPWYPETNSNGDSVMAEFSSRIPCTDCERLKFSLVIYQDEITELPTTYVMGRVYVGRDENRITNSGVIRIINGTSIDPAHIVYELVSGAPPEFRWFWKVDDNLLFILDSSRTPRVGDAGYGYVLNRIR